MRYFERKCLSPSELEQQHRRLRQGYLLGLGLIGLLALGLLGLLIAQIDSQGRYARMIDRRETQRVLTLRAAFFSLLLLGPEGDSGRRHEYRRGIVTSLDEIDDLQQAMAEPGLADDAAAAALAGQLREFAAAERALLHRELRGGVALPAPEAASLLAAVQTTLRDAFSDAIESQRNASQGRTRLYQGLATAAASILLLTLLAEARWIFAPLVLGIRRETSALAESGQRLDAVLATVGEAILVADADNVIQTANSEAARVWGYPVEELSGQRLPALVLPGRELAAEAWRAMFPGHGRIETVGIRRDGEPFGLEMSLTSTRLDRPGTKAAGDEAGRLFFTISARDISERLEVARQLAGARDAGLDAARAKGAFVTRMGHEIRAPLDAMRALGQQLGSGTLDAEQRAQVDEIRRQGDALSEVLDDLLDFSHIESGRLTLEAAAFDLQQLVEGVADVLAGRAVHQQLELLAYVAPDVPISLRGDAGRLRQVLLNLVTNALKFTRAGEVILQVTLAAEEEDHVTLHFAVRDTGRGLAPEERAGLFHGLHPGEETLATLTTLATPASGRGVGLLLCRQLVEHMGGSIGVESTPGVGSTFWFTARLERQPSLPGVFAGDGTSEDEMIAALEGVRVLVVDDNATCRELICSRLSAWGMRPAPADSGGAALALLREQALTGTPFEVAMLDLNLGSMDGFTLAWAIHSQPMLARTRLVLMTALGLDNDRSAFRQVGILAAVSKPLKRAAVLQMLAKVVNEEEAAVTGNPPGQSSPEAPPVRTHRIPLADGPIQTGGRRVLLADDNPINRKMTLRQLANLGFAADAVANGREVLTALRAQAYGLVILDLHMPDLDGYDTARTIRRLLQNRRDDHLALIAMTANRTQGDREKCLQAGMNDYLSKPVRQEELKQMLTRWTEVGAGSVTYAEI